MTPIVVFPMVRKEVEELEEQVIEANQMTGRQVMAKMFALKTMLRMVIVEVKAFLLCIPPPGESTRMPTKMSPMDEEEVRP